jgi:hypothetical protein
MYVYILREERERDLLAEGEGRGTRESNSDFSTQLLAPLKGEKNQ